MKKIVSVMLAALMVLSLSICVCADYEEPATLGLFAGGWGNVGTVEVTGPGEYHITASKIDSSDWVIVKNNAGENEPTSIPQGTIIRTTEIKLNGEVMTFNGGADHFDYTVGENGKIEMIYYLSPSFGGSDNFDNRPETITSVEVTFVVDPDNAAAPAEDTTAPAEDTTAPAEDTTAPEENTTAPAEDTTPAPAEDNTPAPAADAAPAETGIVLAVLPMAIAAAAVVISKRK